MPVILTFKEDTHEYFIHGGNGDRVWVPGLSHVLSLCGVSADYSRVSDRVLELARQKGKQVHAGIHALLSHGGEAVAKKIAGKHFGMVEHFANWVESMDLRPVSLEKPLFNASKLIACTIDGLFKTPTGRNVLVEIKTTYEQDPGHLIQLAAQKDAVEDSQCKVHEAYVVYIKPDKVKEPVPLPELASTAWEGIATWYWMKHGRKNWKGIYETVNG